MPRRPCYGNGSSAACSTIALLKLSMPTKTATSISIRRPNRPTFPWQYYFEEMAARKVAVLDTSEAFGRA
jgi:hypothetical protein